MKVVFSGFYFVMLLNGTVAFSNTTPEVVLKAFAEKYPSATSTEWDMYDNLFTVNFIDEDGELRDATFDSNGEWVETVTVVGRDELPEQIVLYVEEEYGTDVEYYETLFVEKSDGNYYSVSFEVYSNDDEKTDNETYTLEFDKDGNLLD